MTFQLVGKERLARAVRADQEVDRAPFPLLEDIAAPKLVKVDGTGSSMLVTRESPRPRMSHPTADV